MCLRFVFDNKPFKKDKNINEKDTYMEIEFTLSNL